MKFQGLQYVSHPPALNRRYQREGGDHGIPVKQNTAWQRRYRYLITSISVWGLIETYRQYVLYLLV